MEQPPHALAWSRWRNLESFTPAVRVRLLRELADAWTRLGDRDHTEALWLRIAAEQPRDTRSRFVLFESALRSNQRERAEAILAELRRLEGEPGKYWRFGTAVLMVLEADRDHAKLEAARRVVDELGRRNKAWGRIPLLAAQIDEQEGNPDKAIDKYMRALELNEYQPSYLARLVRLLVFYQRYFEAEQILHKIEEKMPLTSELTRLGAEIALANQSVPEALRFAAEAVPASSPDYRDCLWLGRIYHGAGADNKAEAILRLAVRQAPHTPETWSALAEQLVRMDKRAEALALALEAPAKVGPGLALFTQARCYEKMGQVAEAEALYLKGLQEQPDDFVLLSCAADFFRHGDQPKKAEPFLRALLQRGSGASPEVVNRARRQLALVLAALGDRPTALALIEASVAAHPKSVIDLRTRAFIQAGQSAERAQAIRLFEDTRRRQPLSVEEQFQLALLYEAAGDLTRTREQLMALLAAQPENAQVLALYIRHLLKNDEVEQARAQLRKLERLEPASIRTSALQTLMNMAAPANKVIPANDGVAAN